MKYLTAGNIPAARHYPAAVHRERPYATLAQRAPALANTDALVPEILNLPLHPYLAEDELEYTGAMIRQFFA
jgi:UDP-2-acetamido-2-deoxy-ribo-hexuluronate aminotransferase